MWKLPSHLISTNTAFHGCPISCLFLFSKVSHWPWTCNRFLVNCVVSQEKTVLTEPATDSPSPSHPFCSALLLFPSCWLTPHPTQQFLQTFLTLFKIQAPLQIWPQKTFRVSSLPELFGRYVANATVAPLLHMPMKMPRNDFLKETPVWCKDPGNFSLLFLGLRRYFLILILHSLWLASDLHVTDLL